MIDFLKGPDGLWIPDEQAIAHAFIDHFVHLYTSSNPTLDPSFASIFLPTITEDDNNLLCAFLDNLEIQQATFALEARKSPGPDGMSALFYQRYWKTVGEDVTKAVQSFFKGNFLLQSHNHTHIALIPKGESAATVHNYRLISLCNIFYKIISKLLATRLKMLLPKIISPFQTTFVSDKNINENSIIAHEIMHFLKTFLGK